MTELDTQEIADASQGRNQIERAADVVSKIANSGHWADDRNSFDLGSIER